MRRIARIKRSIMPPAGRRGCSHRSRSDINDSPTGFILEDSGQSFVLDVADLVRDTVTIPCAFKAAAIAEDAMTDYDKLWFPRPRGDGPLLVSLPQTVQPVSPPARGWSWILRAPVLPRPVGMVPMAVGFGRGHQ